MARVALEKIEVAEGFDFAMKIAKRASRWYFSETILNSLNEFDVVPWIGFLLVFFVALAAVGVFFLKAKFVLWFLRAAFSSMLPIFVFGVYRNIKKNDPRKMYRDLIGGLNRLSRKTHTTQDIVDLVDSVQDNLYSSSHMFSTGVLRDVVAAFRDSVVEQDE